MAADEGAHPGVTEPPAGETENLRRDRDERAPDRREDQHNVKRDDAPGAPGARDQKPPEKRTRWPLIALGVVIVLGLIAGAIYWWLTRNQVSTDDAYTDGRAVMIAPHVSGYVTQLAVDDNQRVHKGDLLIQLEQKDFLAARDQAAGQLAAVQAQLDSARVALDKAETIYPAQFAQAQGQLEQARGQLYQAQAEYTRQHGVPRAATSQQSIDASTANLQQAEGQVKQAEAQVVQAGLIQQNLTQAKAQVAQLEGQVEQARGNLEQAEINLSYTRVTAPQDGWVTKRNVEMGNYAQSGAQIMAIVSPEVWVTANFKETQLNRMRPGERVAISVDAYPGLKLTGHVDSVQLGSGSKFSAFPPENATGNFVKIVQRVPVKLVIDGGLDPNLPLPLGISVVPTVTLQ
ncbi:MAG: multidrug export protein EmrA [Rhodospirillales bacterium]|nr:multidrug export protein EmrA [Rhodospirillales bacterium]